MDSFQDTISAWAFNSFKLVQLWFIEVEFAFITAIAFSTGNNQKVTMILTRPARWIRTAMCYPNFFHSNLQESSSGKTNVWLRHCFSISTVWPRRESFDQMIQAFWNVLWIHLCSMSCCPCESSALLVCLLCKNILLFPSYLDFELLQLSNKWLLSDSSNRQKSKPFLQIIFKTWQIIFSNAAAGYVLNLSSPFSSHNVMVLKLCSGLHRSTFQLQNV